MMRLKKYIAFSLASLFLYGVAHAGNVDLYNESWDNIPRLLIKKGLNGDREELLENVPRGFVASAVSRLCYKRSSDPSNSNSPLTPNWTCASQTVSGTYEMKVN